MQWIKGARRKNRVKNNAGRSRVRRSSVAAAARHAGSVSLIAAASRTGREAGARVTMKSFVRDLNAG